ncbi:MAG TPA: HU family DNA-binding protein [Spirochaetales bacterium]|nr:HU family DNA-binding protein [Spirochaetales bacterium]
MARTAKTAAPTSAKKATSAKPASKKTTTVAKKPAAKTVKAVAKPSAKKLSLPSKFTVNSMAAYLSELRDISRKDARELLDQVFGLVESGVMAGQRVPLGAMGKMHVKIKPATKARMGRNPMTGEPVKIAAKKASKVPRFTFSKAFKETALKAKITE